MVACSFLSNGRPALQLPCHIWDQYMSSKWEVFMEKPILGVITGLGLNVVQYREPMQSKPFGLPDSRQIYNALWNVTKTAPLKFAQCLHEPILGWPFTSFLATRLYWPCTECLYSWPYTSFSATNWNFVALYRVLTAGLSTHINLFEPRRPNSVFHEATMDLRTPYFVAMSDIYHCYK